MRAQRMAVLGCTALLAVGAAACGSSSDDNSGTQRDRRHHAAKPAKGNADTVILGTTDKVVSLDPAGAYDLGSQQLIGNMYQNLLSVPAGGNKPEPDAAESCDFTDPKTYVCKLKAGPEVLERRPADVRGRQVLARPQLKIADPSGPSSLLASLKSVEATDPTTVTMNLKKADAHVALHPHAQRRGDRRRTRSTRLTRSSPTTRRSARARTSSTSTRPTSRPCSGRTRTTPAPNKAQTPNFIVQYFEQASALKLAIEQGDVDVAYRSLSPTDLEALKSRDGQGRQGRRRRRHRDPLHRLQRQEEAGRQRRRA